MFITYILSISSRILIFLSICPSVLRVVGCTQVELHTHSSKQYFPQLGSEFSISIWYNHFRYTMYQENFPLKYVCNLCCYKYRLNIYKMCFLINLSTRTMIESCCLLVLESLGVNYKEITSHFHSRMGNGLRSPIGCWCSTFTCWRSKRLAKYYATSFFMPSQ